MMFIDTLSWGGPTKIEYHHVKENHGRGSICFDLQRWLINIIFTKSFKGAEVVGPETVPA